MVASRKALLPSPASEFEDLAAAFANPTGSRAASGTITVDPASENPVPRSPEAANRTAKRGRPRMDFEIVNQTLSLRADQVAEVHQIAAAEYARLGRRVLPSEIVRALLDVAMTHLPPTKEILR